MSENIAEKFKIALDRLAETKPKKEESNTHAIIQSLAPKILKLIKSGYSVKEIATEMHNEVNSISISTIKGYISEIKNDRNKSSNAKSQKSKKIYDESNNTNKENCSDKENNEEIVSDDKKEKSETVKEKKLQALKEEKEFTPKTVD